jgi:hypothetical protein
MAQPAESTRNHLPPLDGFTDRDQDGPFVLLLGNVEITRQRSRILA